MNMTGKFIFSLLTVFLVGMCVGIFGHHKLMQNRIRHFRLSPDEMPKFITDKIDAAVGLTEEQRAGVLAIVTETGGKMKEAREQGEKLFDAVRHESRAKIRALLSPEQQMLYQEFLTRREAERQERRNRMPPPPPPKKK